MNIFLEQIQPNPKTKIYIIWMIQNLEIIIGCFFSHSKILTTILEKILILVLPTIGKKIILPESTGSFSTLSEAKTKYFVHLSFNWVEISTNASIYLNRDNDVN